MSQSDPKIDELERRLDALVRTQVGFQKEIIEIRERLLDLRGPSEKTAAPPPTPSQPPPAKRPPDLNERWRTVPPPPYSPPPAAREVEPPAFGAQYDARSSETRTDGPGTSQFGDKLGGYVTSTKEEAGGNLEKFIGENLISKIGIVVLILGVGIFAKYAIDNGWITPVMRVVFGYVIGLGLLGAAYKFRDKYGDFSAVLLSGGMAILYFITYFAYAYYELMPQPLAFGLMVGFTVFTVASAVLYNRQVIAHIGLVGAYAVPFLLNNNSGRYAFLFAYMAILNVGILALAIKKSWRPVFYTASVFTWIIFGSWLFTKFRADEHLYLALGSLGVFFAIFYTTKLIHRVGPSEDNDTEDLIATVVTTVIFYLFAFGIGDAVRGNADQVVYFSYVGLFALAILITSYRFYGRALAYVAYPFTWMIYGAWFFKTFQREQDFTIAAAFASLYFLIFYATTLMHRLVSERLTLAESVGLLLTNSFIFYGFTYALLDSRENLGTYEGLFTVAHGAFHFLVAIVVSRLKPKAVDVVQTLTVLIITFATVAVPIQFDGNRITLIWSVEAAVLFYFGRRKAVWLFECLSYPMMFLAAAAMLKDWLAVYEETLRSDTVVRYPFLNGDVVTAIVFIASFVFIYRINKKEAHDAAIESFAVKAFGRVVAFVALFAFYNMIRMEIGNYFQMVDVARNFIGHDVERFNFLTQLDYTMLFLVVLGIANLQKLRSVLLAVTNIGLLAFCLVLALTAGMFMLYGLRETYLASTAVGLFGMPLMNVAARPITYTFMIAVLVIFYEYARGPLLDKASERSWRMIAFEAVAYPSVLIILSCELMNIAAHLHIGDADKYGLSILWGVFSLAVIVIGIARARAHLRIAAMVLLAATLIKLFFYDIAELGTLPKTLLFVSLGVLLLVISFLYNKYKTFIFGSVADEGDA